MSFASSVSRAIRSRGRRARDNVIHAFFLEAAQRSGEKRSSCAPRVAGIKPIQYSAWSCSTLLTPRAERVQRRVFYCLLVIRIGASALCSYREFVI